MICGVSLSGLIMGLSLCSFLFKEVSTLPGPFPQGEDEDGTKQKTTYKCEGDDITIQCDVSESIRVIRANYGRFSIAICNEHGYTDWSVNCMSPRTTRVLQKKCDGKRNCTMPVNSNVFGDPCPQTRKYVEVHYSCVHKFRTTTKRPLPPWFLENGASELWNNKKSSSVSTEAEVKNETAPTKPSPSLSSPFSVGDNRRPILVTQPTTPVRIPITTPRLTSTTSESTTFSSTTTTTTTISTATTSDVHTAQKIATVPSPFFTSFNEGPDPIEIVDIQEEDLKSLCPSVTSRNVVWPWTIKGDIAIVQCPRGATGLARWACVDDDEQSGWAGVQPDMSDCKSVAMTDLEVRVREKEPENAIAYSLAHLTSAKDLYGGDLDSAVAVLRTISNRINYLLKNKPDSLYDRESYIQDIFQNVVRSAGNLIAFKHRQTWNDMHKSRQMKIASSLMISLEENALLLARVIDNPEFLEEISTNIVMALSVTRSEFNINGTGYPLKKSSETRPFEHWSSKDSIHVDRKTLLEHSDSKGLAKVVFFSYLEFDDILSHAERNFFKFPSSGYVLNSKIISATLAGYKFGQRISHPGITVTLGHSINNATDPLCVAWDYNLHLWSDEGCTVVETDKFAGKTTCQCDRFSNFALMMKLSEMTPNYPSQNREAKSSLSRNTILSLEIAIYVATALSVIFVGIIVFKYRTKLYKILVKYDCFKDEKKTGCPKSQSFYNGVNLMTSSSSNQDTVPYKSTINNFTVDSQCEYSNDCVSRGQYRLESEDGMKATKHLRDVVYMSPQLTQLTNTLKAKKKHCNGDHQHIPESPHSPPCNMRNDDTILPEKEVVFRAVSPHGHVYWEIDPKKEEESDDVSSSRQSSNRYSDNRSLIKEDDESGSSSPANVLVNPFAELSMISESLTNNRHFTDSGRFNSLRNPPISSSNNKLSSSTFRRGGGNFDEVQRQVQIRDIRSIPVSVKSNDYILAKIQSHMGRNSPAGQVFRENVKQRKV